MVKKALIFDPYLDTLGGGEFYTLSVGEFLITQGFKVEVAWSEKNTLKEASHRFALNYINKLKINKKAFFCLKQKGNLAKKYLLTKDYQLIFFLSDGSIPFLMAKKNFIHFQSPFLKINGDSFLNQLKLKNISKIICNSQFTKKYIDQEFKVNSRVVYPLLSDKFLNLKSEKKENIILSVGRFDEILNSKKQDILINTFKKMVKQGLKEWKLVLIGGLLKENKDFQQLKKSAKGYPIKILTNASFKTLLNYYQKAKIYWHAAGFGENLETGPQKAEHFGISIVEAAACSAIPLVFAAGGPKEIVNQPELLWQTKKELINKTKKAINKDIKIIKAAEKLKSKLSTFGQKNFFKQLETIFNESK